jgi:anti-sigma regulatory factor (Ser/Thr protein kinase)
VAREYRLLSDPFCVAEARGIVRDRLRGYSSETVAEVELVVSELVTNAVRHGPGGSIVLRLETEPDGAIVGEVEDEGDGTIEIRSRNLGDPAGGLGLPIVDRLATSWGVYPGSTHVWFRFEALE